MSNQQVLIIHKFEILFNILNEIEKFLNFKLEHINTDKIEEIIYKKNYQIISGEKNFKFNNQININEFPIDIIKLVEIININFLKIKFNQQNNIKVGNYFINLNSRVMNKNIKNISLTEKEAKIIIFLSKSKKPIPIFNLQKEDSIIEPFICLIRLSILEFKPNGTKISINNNQIKYNIPNILQGPLRWSNGDNREDIHNIFYPIKKACEWFDLSNDD